MPKRKEKGVIAVCTLRGECSFQRRRRMPKNNKGIFVNVCTWKDHCNQKSVMTPQMARSLLKRGLLHAAHAPAF